MEPLTPMYTADLFPALHVELILLLRSLGEDDWMRPTVAGAWRVRDIAGHLLDVDLRKLSGGRDEHRGPGRAVSSYADIVELINGLNAGGVRFAERLSPRVLTDLLNVTGPWLSDFVASLDPHGEARISVLWAGEERSENWMDVGREYTERWHHQMQIRDAVGAAGLVERRWLHPLLDLSVRAFPHAYANVEAPPGTSVVFAVDGDEPYAWSVVRDVTGWTVIRGVAGGASASVRTDAGTAWKLLYNALPHDEARARVAISGEPRLVAPMLGARSVMV